LVAKHITIGLFKAFDTFGPTLTKYLTKLLNKYDFNLFFSYVEDEGSNLNSMTTTLKLVVSCDILGLADNLLVILAMHSLRLVNMLQLMKNFVSVLNMYLSKVPNLT